MIERYASFATFYKLEILEVLKDGGSMSQEPISQNELPAALLPLRPNECLMAASNGEMVVDGMRIYRPFTDDDPVLRPTGEYLIVGFFEGGKTILGSAAQTSAIFDVSGRNFSPAGFKPNVLAQELKEATGYNLDQLREYLRR